MPADFLLPVAQLLPPMPLLLLALTVVMQQASKLSYEPHSDSLSVAAAAAAVAAEAAAIAAPSKVSTKAHRARAHA
jgi:hypothetical protein